MVTVANYSAMRSMAFLLGRFWGKRCLPSVPLPEIAMRATALLPLAFVAACASITPKDLEAMSTAVVCYIGVTDPEKRAMAAAEIERRGADCKEYAADIKRREAERQAGM